MSVYTGNIPQPNDIPAQSQSLILQNFTYISSTLGQDLKAGDHQIASGDLNTATFEGRHIQVCLNNRNGTEPDPSIIADGVNGVLFAKQGNLFYWPTFSASASLGPYQLTTGSTSAGTNASFGGSPNGWTFFPGNLIMQYGSETLNASGSLTPISFSRTFPNGVPFVITTGLQSSTSNSPSANGWFIKVGSITTTGFNVVQSSGSSSNVFYYMAIGLGV